MSLPKIHFELQWGPRWRTTYCGHYAALENITNVDGNVTCRRCRAGMRRRRRLLGEAVDREVAALRPGG